MSMGRRRAGLGAVALLALLGCALAILPAQAAKPRKGTRFAGETRQGHDLSFRTTRGGKRIKRLRVTLDITCRRASDRLTSVRRSKFRMTETTIKVERDGSFTGLVEVKGDAAYEVRAGQVSVNGHFHSRRRAGGTIRQRLRLAEGLNCTSGDLHFTVRARPRD
jgi:hypothetical protein